MIELSKYIEAFGDWANENGILDGRLMVRKTVLPSIKTLPVFKVYTVEIWHVSKTEKKMISTASIHDKYDEKHVKESWEKVEHKFLPCVFRTINVILNGSKIQ